MLNVKTVAIIGSGISGLGAIKSCLEEGLIPTCFEMFDSIGGTWNLTEEHIEGQGAAVYASMRLNTSRHMTCYSDFPFPDYDDIDGEVSEKRDVECKTIAPDENCDAMHECNNDGDNVVDKIAHPNSNTSNKSNDLQQTDYDDHGLHRKTIASNENCSTTPWSSTLK